MESSTGFRLPLTCLPTVEVLVFGLIILDIGGLAFFNSRPGFGPTVGTLFDGFDTLDGLLLAGLNWFINLTLLLCGAPGSSDVCLGTTCPDMVLFRSPTPAATLLLRKD